MSTTNVEENNLCLNFSIVYPTMGKELKNPGKETHGQSKTKQEICQEIGNGAVLDTKAGSHKFIKRGSKVERVTADGKKLKDMEQEKTKAFLQRNESYLTKKEETSR